MALRPGRRPAGCSAQLTNVASFIGAGLMLVLSIFGYVHLRRTAPEAEILPNVATRVHVNAS
jgi:hypothetical protein